MIVSNNKNFINELNTIFKNYNCKLVKINDNIQDAQKNILLEDFDFYFLDTFMSIEDISYLIDIIKDLKEKYKIIMMSDDIPEEKEKKIRSLGITYLLKEPFFKDEVKELLEY